MDRDQQPAREQPRGDGRSVRPTEPLKSYTTILDQELRQAESELKRARHSLFLSGVMAGLGIVLSTLLVGIVWTRFGGFDSVSASLVASAAYSAGFIIVIHGRSDLFTEYTTIAILPVLTGDSTLRSLARLWALIYVGNLVGAVAMAAAVSALGPGLGVVAPGAFGAIARLHLHDSWSVAVGGAVLAGWLMGLLSWLVTAGRDTMSQIFFIALITGSVAFAHLPHAITGTADVVAGALTSATVGVGDVAWFVGVSTLGNAIGGVLFAFLIRWSLVLEARGPQ